MDQFCISAPSRVGPGTEDEGSSALDLGVGEGGVARGAEGPPGGTANEEPDWAPDARDPSAEIAALAGDLARLTCLDLPQMGLTAGLRPAADVDLLLTIVAQAEYELARRMDAASRSGSLPLVGDGALPLARSWSAGWSRRLARTGAFARRFPGVAAPWAAGQITSEHVDALARHGERLSDVEMAAVVEQLADRWGRHSPGSLARFVQRVVRALHPPPDPEPDELDAYASRSLSFSVLGDTVVLAGTLPRLEGESVMMAVDAWAERLRSAADHVPPAARRADGLVALVNNAAASDALPSRGGLPVSLSVVLRQGEDGDAVWVSGRDHLLTRAEERFAACSGDVTPVLATTAARCARPSGPVIGAPSPVGGAPAPLAARIAALAGSLLDERAPLAVGRTQRSATAAQRRALGLRDGGCVIPGCGVPADACQAHHLVEWSAGGPTDLSNLVLLCWTHHRQVDLRMWQIEPASAAGADPPTGAGGHDTGLRWPGNNGSPWMVHAVPRSRWRT